MRCCGAESDDVDEAESEEDAVAEVDVDIVEGGLWKMMKRREVAGKWDETKKPGQDGGLLSRG